MYQNTYKNAANISSFFVIRSSWEMHAATYLYQLGWNANQTSLYLMCVYGIFLLLEVPFILPYLHKHHIAEHKLISYPYIVAALGCIFFFQYSKTLSNLVLMVLFSIGSIIVMLRGLRMVHRQARSAQQGPALQE